MSFSRVEVCDLIGLQISRHPDSAHAVYILPRQASVACNREHACHGLLESRRTPVFNQSTIRERRSFRRTAPQYGLVRPRRCCHSAAIRVTQFNDAGVAATAVVHQQQYVGLNSNIMCESWDAGLLQSLLPPTWVVFWCGCCLAPCFCTPCIGWKAMAGQQCHHMSRQQCSWHCCSRTGLLQHLSELLATHILSSLPTLRCLCCLHTHYEITSNVAVGK
jgi:hypothetical protein